MAAPPPVALSVDTAFANAMLASQGIPEVTLESLSNRYAGAALFRTAVETIKGDDIRLAFVNGRSVEGFVHSKRERAAWYFCVVTVDAGGGLVFACCCKAR